MSLRLEQQTPRQLAYGRAQLAVLRAEQDLRRTQRELAATRANLTSAELANITQETTP